MCWLSVLLSVAAMIGSASSAQGSAASGRIIDFDRDILPIFEESCFRCHGPERPKSEFRLDNRADALAGGYLNTNNIVPGDSEASLLVKYVAREVEGMEMPPEGGGDSLTTEQVKLLREWIDQGALWSRETEFARGQSMFSARPAMRWISVDGDEQRFREHYGVREGWSGGLERFELREDVNERSFTIDGRVLPHDHDYRVAIELKERDTMFARFGWEQYRKYYDSSGGYYAPYDTTPGAEPFLTLDRELHVDRGKAWAEIGLILPEYPRVVLGYEYRFAEGKKSLLQWQPVIPTGPQNRNIALASKSIDSDSHLIRLDVSYELAGFLLEDRVEFEDYRLRTGRRGVQPFANPFTVRQPVMVREDYEHQRWMNVFRVEKQARDWLLLSGGHLYHQLEGSGGLTINLVETPGQPSLVDDAITIEQWSHVGNLNAQLGPWRSFTLVSGVQGEWSRQEGFGDLVLGTPPFISTNIQPAMIRSDIDRFSIEEHAALRFTGVPFSVLFAEARLKQQQIGQYEEQLGNNTFLRDTDATINQVDARAGFQSSPWRRLSFGGHYRRRVSDNDYDHRRDSSGTVPSGAGYPAFITENNLDTEEVEARVVVRPANWIKTTFTYQWVGTDFTTATDSGPGTPGGRLLAGTSDANVYSAALSLNPAQRLRLSTTFSYADTRTVAFDNGSGAIVPYRGDVYNLIFGGTLTLSEKTDLNAQYYFSRANYEQHNEAAGLPVGIAYNRHGLLLGLTRQWRENLSTGLQYGFFRYREPSASGFNDYDVHAVFATLSMVLQ